MTYPVSFVARQTRKAIKATVTLRVAQKHQSFIHLRTEDPFPKFYRVKTSGLKSNI